MVDAATHDTDFNKKGPILHLALELGDVHWKLGFTTGFGQKPRLRTIGGGDIAALEDEVALAKKRFRLKAPRSLVPGIANILTRNNLRPPTEEWTSLRHRQTSQGALGLAQIGCR